MTHWYEEIDRKGSNAGHMRLADLAEWLIENGRRQEVIDMLRAPWKYDDEYAQMRRENGAKYEVRAST